ncbi:MAG: hypothetical protein ACHQ0J_03085 [Candidatus Dormibacterales bacterium]
MEATPRHSRDASGAYLGATLLIVLGAVGLIANLSGIKDVSLAIPLALGGAFTAAYLLSHRYGFLVPGGILAGVGTGLVIAWAVGAADNGPYVVLCGGLGFLFIYVVDVLIGRVTGRWWPVIPGTAMVLAAGGMASQNEALVSQIRVWSPLVLVAVGVWILVKRGRPIKH